MEDEMILKEIKKDCTIKEKILIHIFRKIFIRIYHKIRVNLFNAIL